MDVVVDAHALEQPSALLRLFSERQLASLRARADALALSQYLASTLRGHVPQPDQHLFYAADVD